jgi:tetrahydromethanopterin S-methyltransferase subunit G
LKNKINDLEKRLEKLENKWEFLLT